MDEGRASLSRRFARGAVIAFLALVALTYVYRQWGPYPITNSEPRGTEIIAFGDSLTAGHGASPGKDYVSLLGQLCGRRVINAGRGGDTTADALTRLERDVLARDPRIVIVMLGGNDLLRGVAPEQAFANLEKIVQAIQERGALVLLAEIRAPIPAGDFGNRYRELARRTGCVLIPDVLSGIVANPKMKSDQIHPNDAGYELIAKRVYERLRPYL
ncbi:MAG: arylesterase [Candidatus Hydrogenedentota bacterium]|jgi:lysophospholipase L1-like esterase|nr:MAG: arylesterase [Candidatus Hydrogenedentota bacterium]